MDEHTAKFLDAQDEASGIPKDSKDSWRGSIDGTGYLITSQPIEAMAIHLPVAKGVVKIKPDGSIEIPEGISTDAAADAFWQAVKAKGLADAQAQRIRAIQERVEGAEKALDRTTDAIAEYYRYHTGGETRGSYDGKPERNEMWRAMHAARAYFAARTKAGEPHDA